MKLVYWSILWFIGNILLPPSTQAQAPYLQSQLPRANAPAIPVAGSLQFTFTQPMSAQAATGTAVRVVSHWRGQLPGTYAGAGTPTLTFTPTQPLLGGEPLRVTVTSAATSQAGTPLASTASYQVTAATTATAGRFLDEEVAVDPYPRYMAVGDINRDGNLDFVVTNTPNARVHVRLGDGQGGFTPPPAPIPASATTASANTTNLALADSNEDGFLDLLALHDDGLNGVLTINYGNGTGNFPTTGGARLTLTSSPRGLAVTDLNGDGHIDLLTTSTRPSAALVYQGNGRGQFTVAPAIPVSVSPVAVAASDVNGDGRPDLLVVSTTSLDSRVAIRLANSTGGYQAAPVPEVAVGVGALGITVADVNHDGQPDLLTANGSGNDNSTISVRLGDGAGGFQPASLPEVSVGLNPTNVAVGDINRDGHPDFIAACNSESSTTLAVRLGDGTGRFLPAPQPALQAGLAPCALALVDLNQDGQLDVLVGNNGTRRIGVTASVASVSVRLGDGAGQFWSPSARRVPTASRSNDLAVGDFNNDGRVDFLHLGGLGASIRLGNGRGGFVPPPAPTPAEVTDLGLFPSAVAVGDLNNDGNLDFVTPARSPTSVSSTVVVVRLGNGLGGFQPPAASAAISTLSSSPTSVVLVDVDNDGKLDLLAASELGVDVRLGDGAGSFRSPAVAYYFIRANPMQIVAGDVNDDGYQDFLTANYRGTVSIWLGNGTGTFSPPTVAEIQFSQLQPVSLALGDVNSDGKLDFIVTSIATAGDEVEIRLGNGTGAFISPVVASIPVNSDPTAVALGDVNGDGNLDMVISGSTPSMMSILLGDGRGSFRVPVVGGNVGAGSYPRGIQLADIDNDGDLDMLIPNGDETSVSVRLNGAFAGSVLPVRPATPAVTPGVTVYPNPAHHSVHIQGVLPPGPYVLYDRLGRPQRRQPAGPHFDLAGLTPGLYLLRCGAQTIRLVVE
jgi:hypothetical protein